MTNYEKYRESIDLILEQEEMIAFNKHTKEVVVCQHLDCKHCLFLYNCGDKSHSCNFNTIKWLVSEYKEEVDWSKVPVDTPVLVSDDGTNWIRRYFAKITKLGTIFVYSSGATSWSASTNPMTHYKYAKLAEVE